MNVDNIVIPGGILATLQGPQSRETEDQRNDNENFDVVEIARQRARSLSTSLSAHEPCRLSILERIASANTFSEDTQETSQQRTQDTARKRRPQFQRQRSISINLGDLGRVRVAGLSDSGDARLQSGLAETEKPPCTIATIEPKDSKTKATESSRKDLERTQSQQSRIASIDVARRASIAVDNVVEKVKDTVNSALRRSSLQIIYEKAKIRQVELKRSAAAQLSFQYTWYLLMLASIYFVFVGLPLWRGLVLTLYSLFNMHLVIPVGTAVFLGTGFL